MTQENLNTTADPVSPMTYVVQREVELADGMSGEYTALAWQDLATVEVPPRTKRSTVIKKALEMSGLKPAEGETLRLRALDAESAEVHEPEAYQPPIEWRI